MVFRFQCLWLMVPGLWFMVYGLWFTVYGLWFIVYGGQGSESGRCLWLLVVFRFLGGRRVDCLPGPHFRSFNYPLCGETLEPLARFVRKLPKDSNLAEEGFPGPKKQEFLGPFSTNHSTCPA